MATFKNDDFKVLLKNPHNLQIQNSKKAKFQNCQQ